MSGLFRLIFTIVPILVIGIFVFAFVMMFSPKLRAKFMAHQLKSQKYMLDENEDILKEINRKSANISKDGIETTAKAIKRGLSQDTIYCKHCGSSIDSDSRFCKNCGQRQ